MPHIVVYDDSFRAATDMSALQFSPVKLHTVKDYVAVCAAATDRVFGILLDKPKLGAAGRIVKFGRVTALADGSGTAIAIGDYLGVNAAGTMLVKKATADYSICAIALEACTISAGKIDVDFFGGAGWFRTAAG